MPISGGFLKSAAEAMGKFLPQIQVRTFRPDELDSAIDFAGSFDPGEVGAAGASAR